MIGERVQRWLLCSVTNLWGSMRERDMLVGHVTISSRAGGSWKNSSRTCLPLTESATVFRNVGTCYKAPATQWNVAQGQDP